MQLTLQESSGYSRIKLKKDMKDYREDLVTCIIINLIYILFMWYTSINFFWILLFLINTGRYLFLTYGNTDKIDFNIEEKSIVDSYKNEPLSLDQGTNFQIANYDEISWRLVKKTWSESSSSSNSLFIEFIFLIFGAIYHVFWFILMKIKPNTDYFEFAILYSDGGLKRIFHLRSNDKDKLRELGNLIGDKLSFQVQFFETEGPGKPTLQPVN